MVGDVNPLQRALDVIEFVSVHGPRSPKEIAAGLDLPPSTTYRLIHQLEQTGYLTTHEGQVGLGVRMLAMVVDIDISKMMGRIAAPVVWALVEETGETTVFTMADGLGARCIESAEPRRAVQLAFRPGQIYPLHRGASAKPLLAFATPEKQAAYLAYLTNLPDGSNLVARARADIARIRRDGVAVSFGELDPGVVAVGAAIFWHDRAIGCLSVAGPADRFGDRQIVAAKRSVIRAAEQLSQRMEAHSPAPMDRPGMGVGSVLRSRFR